MGSQLYKKASEHADYAPDYFVINTQYPYRHTEKYTEQPHLEAEAPDAAAISETVPAEPADEMMAQRTPLQKELVLWQHVASLLCCHLGMPLGGQSMIEPVSFLQYKFTDSASNGA
jgi:hypothetical protein